MREQKIPDTITEHEKALKKMDARQVIMAETNLTRS